MKKLFFLFAFFVATAHAEDLVLRSPKELVQPGRANWTGISASDAFSSLTFEGQRRCPSGFEKLREYAAPDGDAWYLHFVIRCITPATPSATSPAAPK